MKVITPQLASALDRTEVSNRSAPYVVAVVIRSLGHDPEDFSVNRESIRKARLQNRESAASNIRDEFNPQVPLTVHWDGKLLPDISPSAAHHKVERIAVMVSGKEVLKLLAVPKIPDSTGNSQAEAVCQTLQESESYVV